jgi:hypothetical protein
MACRDLSRLGVKWTHSNRMITVRQFKLLEKTGRNETISILCVFIALNTVDACPLW